MLFDFGVTYIIWNYWEIRDYWDIWTLLRYIWCTWYIRAIIDTLAKWHTWVISSSFKQPKLNSTLAYLKLAPAQPQFVNTIATLGLHLGFSAKLKMKILRLVGANIFWPNFIWPWNFWDPIYLELKILLDHFCHTQATSWILIANLKIWKVTVCKMEPESGLYNEAGNTNPPTQPPDQLEIHLGFSAKLKIWFFQCCVVSLSQLSPH